MFRLRLRLLAVVAFCCILATARAEPLPGTKPLTAEGDLAAQMVAGIDKYLMRELEASALKRQQSWKPDFSAPENYVKSLQPQRERLRKLIGVVEPRLPVKELEILSGTSTMALIMENTKYRMFAVRWPVFEGVDGAGLLLEPKEKPVANVIALPDADWTPEMLVGLAPGVPPPTQFARRLAENGCRVVVPVLIDRKDTWSGNPKLGRLTNQPHREFIYRMSYEMGRHIIGYEVQKVLALVDWFCREQEHAPVGIYGYGEGGLLALYSSAVDERVQATVVSGYFGRRDDLWQEPIYRNVWGLLTEFGDAELAALVAPRALAIEPSLPPQVSGPPPEQKDRRGAAPGRIEAPDAKEIQQLVNGVVLYLKKLGPKPPTVALLAGDAAGNAGMFSLLAALKSPRDLLVDFGKPPADPRKDFDPAVRQQRQFDQLVHYTQKLLRDSEAVRQQFFWAKLGGLTPPARLDEYEKSLAPLRAYFHDEVIGKLPAPTEPMNPRTRQIFDEPKWKGYEVTLDLYPDVFAYGILTVPKDLKPGEKRPVVVCQHGLEGRPQDVVNPKMKTRAYNSYGAQLADLGYIVYAPQNPYIGRDNFRVLQRKANPLQLSLFSFIVRQHERTIDWLETLPYVDKQRIAFYGLSYGGKTAMRVPAILERYCLSICSGDFNEWIAKNVSVDFRGSYMFTGEYEMFEFDLGMTFNYAEMAALLAPRPFMVERGHDDGVGIDELVAYEYAKVRRLYSRLGLPERTELEFFAGGHEIHAQGTYAFLKRHLGWPK